MYLNVDLDGVVYPFYEEFARYLFLRGLDKAINPTDEQVRQIWHPERIMAEGEWKGWYRKAVTEGFLYRRAEPIEGAAGALWRLAEKGWYIRIVTHRLNHSWLHANVQQSTIDWLDENNIPYRSIAFLGDEPKDNYTATAIIDDRIMNMSSKFPVNVLFNQPWNELEIPEPKLYKRADSWVEVEEHLNFRYPGIRH